ncbi:hypothetical protein TNIN_341491 [Trichonephila inaurata madagascariensis]|uniref:Uncharacterized protein n=1 Tax=Trichonephila inaurata madagascariensis TaxID=2747483 RepID=A0A8X6JJH9_9ARAC|nr:hypothetical protein TNIN_341491 [Trichonephila inaurata madagascariensis]
MNLPVKVCGELVKLYNQNGMNAANAFCILTNKTLPKTWFMYPQSLLDLIRNICGRRRFRRQTAPENSVSEMHYVVTSENTQTARGIARIFDIPKTTIIKLRR